jgi:transcriptional repressor NrdR
MQCPNCDSTNIKVLESRTSDGGKSIRRRRQCLDCKYRFTTYERIELIPINVIKNNGSKEYYDRSKILRGINRACEKTGITEETIESLVAQVEKELEQIKKKEITSQEIGKLVLSCLRPVSEVAYIRFASVYENFSGIEDFIATLEQLKKQEQIEENTENKVSEEENNQKKAKLTFNRS